MNQARVELLAQRLTVRLKERRGDVNVVNGINLKVHRGETVALVGESGSGKSVTCFAVLNLLPPIFSFDAERLSLGERDCRSLNERGWREIRGRHVGMVVQDSMTAFTPTIKVGNQIAEAMCAHFPASRRAAWSAAVRALADVSVSDPERVARAFPHQLSGGLRQRAMIAMATICRPTLLLADEPTTALDATVQVEIMDTLREEIKQKRGMAMLFVSHDLALVAAVADTVIVMYSGDIMEEGPADRIFASAMHPYTRALLVSRPSRKYREKGIPEIPGLPPEPRLRPSGCPFHPRCGFSTKHCIEEKPVLRVMSSGHAVACHYA